MNAEQTDNIRTLVGIFIPALIVVAYVAAIFFAPDAADRLSDFATPALGLYITVDSGLRAHQRAQSAG